MYLNASTLSSLASTAAWTHWFLPLFQPIGKWIPGWQLWFSFNELGPSTAKACRKFSNSCFRDLWVKLMKEVVLLENAYQLRNYFLIPSDLRTIFFHYGRKLIYALLPADKTVSTRPKRSWSAVHASSYLSELIVNFARHDFALLSTESSRNLSFSVAS